jgi:membrane protease YdiL (CAAX protease family)
VSRTSDLWAFFGLTFACAWLAWGLAYPGVQRALGLAVPSEWLFALGTAAPSAVALILAVRSGKASELIGELARWGVHPGWYTLALLAPPVVMLVAMGLHVLLGGTAPAYPDASRWPLIGVNFIVVLLIGGPLGEELGWRGFVLPHLQSSIGLIWAGLLIGTVWALWHVPLFVLPGSPQSELPFGWFALQAVALSLVLSIVYWDSGRSLLLPVLLHASMNTFAGPLRILPSQTGSTRPFVLTAVVVSATALLMAIRRPR